MFKLILVASLWTIFYRGVETILQYPTEQACREAIEEGLPYLDVPPKEQLSCGIADDQNPVEQCSDGSVAYLRNGLTCHQCIDQAGHALTSVLCEGHGYRSAGAPHG